MKIKKMLIAVAAGLLMASCSTPKLGYFQNVNDREERQILESNIVRLQPGDKLSILVSSKNPELAYLFNLPVVGHYSSSTSGRGLTTSTVAHYTLDNQGNIDFPILGSMHLAGMTRSEVINHIKNTLIQRGELKDPQVTVDFLDMYFSVMGEVKSPGRFIIDHDQVSILDALSRAGDLTIYGLRDNVLVMRLENGTQKSFRVNLTDANSLYTSPVFYLQQNDIVYVEPNSRKARESSDLGNSFMTPGLWLSAASFLTSLIVLIVK